MPLQTQSDAAIRTAVYRIWDSDCPVGTAFAIGPRLALTCHHCVAGRDAAALTLNCDALAGAKHGIQISELRLAPAPECCDIAFIGVSQDFPVWLTMSESHPTNIASLVAYGYPGAAKRQPLIRLDVQSRGEQRATYEAETQYELASALLLSGDPAAAGMSGGPLLDVVANVVIGIIVGGPDYDNRTIAMPLYMVNEAQPWADFSAAAHWNRLKTIQRGWALNHLASKEICGRQIDAAIKRLVDAQRYAHERYVPRQQLTRNLEMFLVADKTCLVVHGGPNLGKTSSMAAFAEIIKHRALLFDGFYITDYRTSFLDYADDQLRKVARLVQDESLLQIAGCLQSHGENLTIFVDAINEIEGGAGEIERWFAEAISGCQENGIKLVVSCRSDVWNALDHSSGEVQEVRLLEFSDSEVMEALSSYDLQSMSRDELGRHPLMFKIMAKLRDEGKVNRGRYGAIDAFVRRQIRDASGIEPSQVDGIFAAVERIAENLDSEGEFVPWSFAVNQVGSTNQLESLIAGGVFKSSDRRSVRFAFDEIAEAMRPALQLDQLSLSSLWTKSLDDEQTGRRLTGSLLKSQASGDNTTATVLLETLLSAIDTLEDDLVCNRVKRMGYTVALITSGLQSKSTSIADDVVSAFIRMAIRQAKSGLGAFRFTLERALVGVELGWRAKARMLIAVLPYCDDYQLRMKDLFDRGGEANLMEQSSNPQTIAAALLRLTIDNIHGMREFLIPQLDNQDRLFRDGAQSNGEVTVGEILAAILQMTSYVEIGQLISALLSRPEIGAAAVLLRDISAREPHATLFSAVSYLDSESSVAVMNNAIRGALINLGPRRAPAQIVEKLRKIMVERTSATRVIAASLLRIASPDDLSAWDTLNFAAAMGETDHTLCPVPAQRANAFVATLRQRSGQYAIDEMQSCNDTPSLEKPMAKLATLMLAAPRFRTLQTSLGLLAESKLYKLKENSEFKPWRKFALTIAASTSEDAKSSLVYFATPTSEDESLRRRVWNSLFAGPCDSQTFERLVNRAASNYAEVSATVLVDHLSVPLKANEMRTVQVIAALAGRQRFIGVSEDKETRLRAFLLTFVELLRMNRAVAVIARLGVIIDSNNIVDQFAALDEQGSSSE